MERREFIKIVARWFHLLPCKKQRRSPFADLFTVPFRKNLTNFVNEAVEIDGLDIEVIASCS